MLKRYGQKKWTRLFLLLFTAGLLTAGLRGERALAASATLTFSGKTSEVLVGDKTSVVLTVESSAIVGDVELYISYDPQLLEFKTGGSNVSGGGGLLKVTDIGSGEESETKKYSISFLAVNTGACEIGISDRASVFDSAGAEMSISSNRYTVTVKESETLSANADLKTLEISPGTLSPAFQKNTDTYSAQVEPDTDKLFVSAVPEDPDAVVEVSGNTGLKEGTNKVYVAVTAASGKKKEYRITVKKLSPEEAAPTNGPEEETEPPLETETPLHAVEEDGRVYVEGSYRYEILTAPKESVPAGYVEGEAEIYEIPVTAYVREEEPDNAFVLLYGKNEEGKEGFYQFDLVEKTMQRWNGGEAEPKNGTEAVDTKSYNGRLSQLSIIIAVLSALSVLLLIIVIKLVLKQKGLEDDDE